MALVVAVAEMALVAAVCDMGMVAAVDEVVREFAILPQLHILFCLPRVST